MKEREMTKRDWKALHFALKLQEQIVLHGESALRTFIESVQDAREVPRGS